MRLILYQPDIVRVDLVPEAQNKIDTSFSVIQDTSAIVKFEYADTDSTFELFTENMKIVCTKFPLRLRFYNTSGRLLLSEPLSGGLSTNGFQRKAQFILQAEDHFYGTGERGNAMVKTMRGKYIPCDALILDLYWFKNMGDITWNSSAFGLNQKESGSVDKFELKQNFPNPFNPVTTIRYNLEKNCLVKIRVYDILGREVSVLLNKEETRGEHIISFDGHDLPSGVYFCEMKAEDFEQVLKMNLVK